MKSRFKGNNMEKQPTNGDREMKEEIINQNETNFERYTGMPMWLFWENVALLIPAKKEKEERGGRKTKLPQRFLLQVFKI